VSFILKLFKQIPVMAIVVGLKKAVMAIGIFVVLTVSLFNVALTEAENLNWNIAGIDYWTIDNPPNGATSQVGSLVLDSLGNPHILCNGKYIVWAGSSWSVQETDFSGQLVLDKNDNPHVCYTIGKYYNADLYLYDIIYSSFLGSNWTKEVVASRLYPDGSPYLAFDLNGDPHITYMRGSASLMYASKNSSGWSSKIVDANAGGGCKLIFDSDNNPHITYQSASDGLYGFSVANWDGTSWNIQRLNGENQGCSIALDSNGNSHIFFAHYYSASWNYASWNGTGWSVQTLAINSTYGVSYSSLAIDSQNKIHVAFWTYNNSFHIMSDTGYLEYAIYNGSSWSIQQIDYQPTTSADLALALDKTGQPHILYAYQHVNFPLDKDNLPYIQTINYQKYASLENLPSFTSVPALPQTNFFSMFLSMFGGTQTFVTAFVIVPCVILVILLVVAVWFQRQFKNKPQNGNGGLSK
jgi:hypothetical protein